MTLFFDTSSLFKLYFRESDTYEIERIFSDNMISAIFLSEISEIEFASTAWKKVRKNEITESEGKKIIERFQEDSPKYTFIEVDKTIGTSAKRMIDKYGKEGLRTLDSIQLSTATFLSREVDLFITSDKLLRGFFQQESLSAWKGN